MIQNRQELIDRVLRNLGFPVISVNVSEEQLEDAIDMTLQYWRRYADDATERGILPVLLDQPTIDTSILDLPTNVQAVYRVLPYRRSGVRGSFADMDPYLAAGELSSVTTINSCGSKSGFGSGLHSYQRLLLNQRFFNSLVDPSLSRTMLQWTYNSIANRVLFSTPIRLNAGDYLALEVATYLDPSVYVDVLNHEWVIEYATARVKSTWASNLSIFENFELPGGGRINVSKMVSDSEKTIERLEKSLKSEYSMPPLPSWEE